MKHWKLALSALLCIALFAAFVLPMQAQAANVTVYLDPANGSDSADGLTEATPVKSYDTAYGKIKTAGGTIVLLSDLNITTDVRLPSTASDIPVVLTSKDGTVGVVGNTNVRFNAPTTLENLTVKLTKASSNVTIFAEGKKLTVGENVNSVDTDGYYFSLAGGKRWAACSSAELVVQSGTWRNIYTSVYGYKSGSTVAGVSGTAKLTMTGGTVTGFIAPSYGNSAVTGNVEISLANVTVPSIFCSPVSTGSVTGDVTLTLGEGAKITGSVYTGSNGSGTVGGKVQVILDGADTSDCNKIINGGGSDYTGSVGSARLTLKSGILGVTPTGFDAVAVDVPAGKELILSGAPVAADTAKAEGTVSFTGAATLTAKAVTDVLNCGIAGQMTYNQNFVVAPAGSNVAFPAGSGVTEVDGKWACRNLEKFRGLVITHDEGVTVQLYQGFGTTTKIEPYLVEGNVRYYPNLSGKYRMVASRTGYIKLHKNIYMSPEEAQTRVDEKVSLVKRDGAWDPEHVYRLTDEALTYAFPSNKALWPEYAAVFTTPAFAEGRPMHKFTTQQELEDFIAGLDDAGDQMYVYSMGVTPTEPAFNMPLVIFTETDLRGAKTLEEAAALLHASGKPTVHYHAQIHGNEQDPGEAALGMIALLDDGLGQQLLDSMNIYVIPRLNPDGAYQHDRRIPSQNIDPNRDFMNLETYEIQRQRYVYNLFMPEVVLDSHEYNVLVDTSGRTHKDIQVLASRAPYATQELKEQSDKMAFAMFDNMSANGLSYGWYQENVSSYGSNVASTYTMQRGSLYYLLEGYGMDGGTYNYERRVMAHISAVEGALRYIDANAETINKTVNDQWQKLIDGGKVYGDGDKIVLQSEYREAPELYLPGKYANLVTGELTDEVFTAKIADKILREREAPTAYIIPADHARIDYILEHTRLHGIASYKIPAGACVMAQHVGGSTSEAVITEEQKTVFANGAYVFGMDQTASRILAYLMEPDVTDNGSDNGGYAVTGVFTLSNGEYPVYRYVRNLNSENKIDYTVVAEAPKGLTGVFTDGSGVISGLETDKLYEYRMEGQSEYTSVAAGSDKITGLQEGVYYVRYQVADGQEAGADAVMALYGDVIVYLDQKNGSDDNDGYSEAAAVATIEKAYAQLSAKAAFLPEGKGGMVMFLSEYVNTAYTLTFPSHNFPVTLTSKTGAEGLHYKVSGTSSNRIVNLGGDTTLKHMTLTVTAAGNFNYFCAGGHKLVIEEDVVTAGAQKFMLVGGRFSTNVTNADMTVKAGTWANIYLASYQASHAGPVKLTMTGGTVTGLIMPSYNKAITGDITLYFENTALPAVYCGNAKTGNITGNVDVTLGKGVTFTSFYAGSRDAGNISGTVTVTVDGADLTGLHLYGKAKNDTATIGKSVLVYKSGKLGTHSDFDEFVDMSAAPEAIRGDMNGDGTVSDADAMYLLRYTLFGAGRYPLSQSGDVNGDGTVSDGDAMYLLRYTLFGESRYPLH